MIRIVPTLIPVATFCTDALRVLRNADHHHDADEQERDHLLLDGAELGELPHG
jgi:hypothetical protein